MIQTGLYLSRNERTDPALDLLVRYKTPLDFHFKLLQLHTKGRPGFYPAMTYSIRYDGMMRIGCMDHQNLFTEGIPKLARTAVPCPQQQCEGCTDMHRAPAAEPPNAPIFGYVDAREGRFFVQARSRDRVRVSGWVASRRGGLAGTG